jgi:hypothetical protein
MYRIIVSRLCISRVYPSVNIHLSTPKLEETPSKNVQQTKSSDTNDEVKFDYINKTGIIQLNKPKTLNALSSSMIEKIYPKMKVCIYLCFNYFIRKSILAMGNRWKN